MPHVSVVVPTYNRADYIGSTIQSVLDQTLRDFELIVVDDGSTDHTADAMSRFTDPRIRYVRQANAGETAARNTGIAHAASDLLTFLDSDDWMLPHNLELMVGLLEARPDVDVAYGWFYLMREDDHPIYEVHGKITGAQPLQLDQPWPGAMPRPSGTILEGKIFDDLILEPEGTLSIGGAVVRRACVEAIQGFDPKRRHQGHWDFYLRLARAGCTYACTRQAVVVVRIHAGGAHMNGAAMYAARLDILDDVFQNSGAPAQTTLAIRRDKAYFNTHLNYAKRCWAGQEWQQGGTALNQAMRHARLSSADIADLSDVLAHATLVTPTIEPAAFVDGALASLTAQPTVRQIRNRALAIVNMELARRAYALDKRGRVLAYWFKAVRHDRACASNRGMARIALEDLIGSIPLERIRKRTHPTVLNRLPASLADATCLFISPHFDDAILSCGGAIARFARQGVRQQLVTVFTADLNGNDASPSSIVTLSPLARHMHEAWGGSDRPFQMRSCEDKAVAARLGIPYHWLGFYDAVYRDSNLSAVPQLFDPHFDGRSDVSFVQVRARLAELVRAHPDGVLFAPLGLGNHRDHLIVHEASADLRRTGEYCNPIYFYEDFPYAARVTQADFDGRLVRAGRMHTLQALVEDIRLTMDERVALTQMYTSQMVPLFGGPEHVRYAIASYAMRIGSRAKPVERFWCFSE